VTWELFFCIKKSGPLTFVGRRLQPIVSPTASPPLAEHHFRQSRIKPAVLCIYTVWVKKIPPEDLWQFFQNSWEFFKQILHAYYAFISTLDCEFVFIYLQLWRSYAILSVTTQFTSCAQDVHHRPKRMLAFSGTFPKQLGIFSPNFTRLLNVHIYARLQIFIQLYATVTKLCHIKCDHSACVSVVGGHFEHIMVVALNILSAT